MNYPHVRPGWQFLSPPDSELRMLGAIAEITERRDDLVRVEVIFPDGTRRPSAAAGCFMRGRSPTEKALEGAYMSFILAASSIPGARPGSQRPPLLDSYETGVCWCIGRRIVMATENDSKRTNVDADASCRSVTA
jgi:hypothetical protein